MDDDLAAVSLNDVLAHGRRGEPPLAPRTVPMRPGLRTRSTPLLATRQSTHPNLGRQKRAAWQFARSGLAVALLAAALPTSGEQRGVEQRADLISAARAIMLASPHAAL